jgi:small subunit ribosomal protein S9
MPLTLGLVGWYMSFDNNVSAFQYSNLIYVMERLVQHPYSYRLKDFIEKFRKPLLSQTSALVIPKVGIT